MKGIFLFCTKLQVYLIELPLIIMMSLAIHYNGEAEGGLKFYPLIVILGAGILFILLYFFRGIYITSDDISDVGIFSARERVFIKKDCTLVISLRKKRKINIDLLSKGDKPAFDWMKSENDITRDVRIYHRVAIGGKNTAVKLLSFLGVDKSKAIEIAEKDAMKFDDGNISIITENKHDLFEIRVKFLKVI